MDASDRLRLQRDKLKLARKMQMDIIFANNNLKKIADRTVENSSALVKYRENISVPAQWIPQQGVRVNNIPMIPAEKIVELDRYITVNTKKIDGGDLDVVET
jgi:hypothetical protein